MATGQLQVLNTDLVDNLSTRFQLRNESNFAWKSMCAMYQALPCLRGFWPMSSQLPTGHARDLGGGGFTLTPTGTPLYGYQDLIPYVELDGTDDALYTVDAANWDITGTEANVVAAQRGLTVGCWFKTDTVAAGVGMLASKWTVAGNQRSYALFRYGALMRMIVSSNGTLTTPIDSSNALDASAWHLAIGRYAAGLTLTVFLDGTKTMLAAGVPAAIYGSSAEFNVGASDAHTSYWVDGKIGPTFVCACALSDAICGAIWQQGRAMFGR
jgi:hypothetical protein